MADDTSPVSPERSTPSGMTFLDVVLWLGRGAAVHFGDVADPATGRPGVTNLAAARQVIDVLAILEEKTRGNLSIQERAVLEQLVAELQVRYVHASGTSPAGAGGVRA